MSNIPGTVMPTPRIAALSMPVCSTSLVTVSATISPYALPFSYLTGTLILPITLQFKSSMSALIPLSDRLTLITYLAAPFIDITCAFLPPVDSKLPSYIRRFFSKRIFKF